jgi:linoleoyl-CoA desaturase
MMNDNIVRFNNKNQSEFFKELNKKVNNYFKENKISRHANLNMKIKTVFMISLYLVPFVLMLTGLVSSGIGVMLMWLLMGLGMSGIGLSIMHDANHGSYSKNKKVNRLIGLVINSLGAYHANWKIQHNVLHHSYTNIHGHDEDIEQIMFRLSPTQEKRPIFRFQAFYAPFLYGLMTIYWFVAKDYEQLFRYHKKGLLAGQGLTFRTALAQIVFHKTWYMLLFLILPLVLVNVPWWQIILGFLAMHFICGLILTLIFQPAHVIEDTNFYETDEEGNVENSWAIHQMHTTSNFANDSRLFSWLIGGLNYQIEHHLFPHICHVHYRKISVLVKETAEQFNVPYFQHKSFAGAVKSHFILLHQLGTGKYDELRAAEARA